MTEEWFNIFKMPFVADKFGNQTWVSPKTIEQQNEEKRKLEEQKITDANAREAANQKYREEQAKIPYTGGARPMPTAPGKFTDRQAWQKQMGARKVSDRSTTAQTMPKTSHPTKQRVAAGFKAIGDTRAAEAKEAARPMTQGDMANAKNEINQQIQALQAELRNLQNAQPQQQ